jgi:murein DD-endopeptidase MepM/ murein hydrolase activator NlpD
MLKITNRMLALPFRINFKNLASWAVVALLVSACATPAVHNNKRGLLDSDSSDRSSSMTEHSHSSDRNSRFVKNYGGKGADEVYAPKEGELVRLSGNWAWPLHHVEISSTYGDRGHKFHQGIDLRASVGTPVYAASDGEVTYVGSKIRGYGRMIVLKHANGFFTVYAHHSKNLVKLHHYVKCGDLIAYSGKSGHAHGPHLHFELRKGTQSYDPEFALSGIKSKDPARTIASEQRSKQDPRE